MNTQPLRIKKPLLPGTVIENSPLINSGTNNTPVNNAYRPIGQAYVRSTLLGNNTPLPINKAYGPTGLNHARNTLLENTPRSLTNVTVSVAPTFSVPVAPTPSVPVPVAPGQASLWTTMRYGDATKRFISAFERNDEKEMEKAIRQGADLKKGLEVLVVMSEPLEWAAYRGYLGIVRFLLDRGANVADMYLALQGICKADFPGKRSWLEIARLLIDRGVDVNALPQKGATALMWASQKGHLEIARLLLDRRANVNAARINGATSLMLASQYGHLEIVRLLLAKGANVNAATMEEWEATGEGWTSLMLASSVGHLEIARLLLAKGANVNAARPDNGWTSLMLACSNGHLEIVKLLCSAGADTNQRSIDLKRAIDYAHNLEIKKFLETDCHKTTEGGKFSRRKRAKRTRRKVTGKNKSHKRK